MVSMECAPTWVATLQAAKTHLFAAVTIGYKPHPLYPCPALDDLQHFQNISNEQHVYRLINKHPVINSHSAALSVQLDAFRG